MASDIVQKILKHRSIYVAYTYKNNVAVEYAYQPALQKLLRAFFENFDEFQIMFIISICRFNDNKLYSMTGYDSMCKDSNHKYCIQEWTPDCGLVSQKTFNFNSWIFSEIIKKKISHVQMEDLLRNWKTSVLETDEIPQEIEDALDYNWLQDCRTNDESFK